MKKLLTLLLITVFFTISNFLISQTTNKSETKPSIEYPFPCTGKFFYTNKASKEGLGSDNSIIYSFDKKYGLWFIENNNLHHYDLDKNIWKAFNKDNGLFKGKIGVIYHDSQGQTWIGSQRDPFFDGFGTSRLYEGGISVYNGETLKTFDKNDIEIPSAEITDIIEDSEGRIFIANGESPEKGIMNKMWPGGLFVHDNNAWRDYSKGKPKCPFKFIEEFYLDSRKKVWMKNGGNSKFTKIGHSLCYFEEGRFVEPKLKGVLLEIAFSNNNIWAVTKISPHSPRFYKYNPSSSEFERLKEKLEMPVIYKSTVLEDDLVVFFVGSNALNGLNIKKWLKALGELKIQIIDAGKVINSSDHALTKDLYFNCSTLFRNNEALIGTDKGIVVYKNGDFLRKKEFNILNNKSINEIFITSGQSLFIVCNNSELYFFGETLEKVDISNDSKSFINIGEITSGGFYATTDSKAFMIKGESSRYTVQEIFNKLENCYQVFEFKDSLYFLSANAIFPFAIN